MRKVSGPRCRAIERDAGMVSLVCLVNLVHLVYLVGRMGNSTRATKQIGETRKTRLTRTTRQPLHFWNAQRLADHQGAGEDEEQGQGVEVAGPEGPDAPVEVLAQPVLPGGPGEDAGQ